ncbi:MAG: glycosyltransferase family 2 protein [Lachnospiraceae bacterium]
MGNKKNSSNVIASPAKKRCCPSERKEKGASSGKCLQKPGEAGLDLSVVLPCLNEAGTVGVCVQEALVFLRQMRLSGEVLVVDNGSTDGSANAASQSGARVVLAKRRGYGAALRAGFAKARGRVIIMGDCDATYDFLHLQGIYEPLAAGTYDLVIGDRFAGGIQRGAMPLSHKLGVRFLSAVGRYVTKTNVRDFHCGLRGLTKEAACRLPFQTTGMEFATEMIALAAHEGLRIGQTPVALRRCPEKKRKSKLRTLPDGLRHLRYMANVNRQNKAAERQESGGK